MKFLDVTSAYVRRNVVLALAAAILATSAASSASAAAPTSADWVSMFNAWDAAHGTKDLTSTDGNVLAWSEGEILNSYMYMYLTTKNPSYMTEATTHIDYLWKVAALNQDGAGWAWTSTASSVEKLVNSTLSTADAGDSTLPAGWVRGPGTTSASAYLAGGTGPGVTIVQPATGVATLSQTFNTYSIRNGLKTMYELSATAEGKGTISVSINGVSAGSLTFSHANWQPILIDFYAPTTAGENITVTFSSTTKKDQIGDVLSVASATVNARLEYLDQDGMILHAITHYIDVVNSNQPTLSAFSAKAATYLSYIKKQNFDTRWNTEWITQGSDGFFIFPLDWSEERATPGDGPGTTQPYNEYQEYGRFMVELYKVTGDKTYLNKAIYMGNTLKAAMMPNGQGVVWHYMGIYTPQDVGRTPKIEDSAHANFDISFIDDLYEVDNTLPKKADQVFMLADMKALDYTFMHDMFNQPSAELYRFVTGAGGLNVSPWNHSYANWTQVSVVDPTVLTAVTALFQNTIVTTTGNDYYPLDMAKMAYYSSL